MRPGSFVAPIFDYRHLPDDCAAVVAGHRYRGPSMPALQGTLYSPITAWASEGKCSRESKTVRIGSGRANGRCLSTSAHSPKTRTGKSICSITTGARCTASKQIRPCPSYPEFLPGGGGRRARVASLDSGVGLCPHVAGHLGRCRAVHPFHHQPPRPGPCPPRTCSSSALGTAQRGKQARRRTRRPRGSVFASSDPLARSRQ